MTIRMSKDLPKYVPNMGPNRARQLENTAQRYRARIQELRDVIDRADEAWAEAFARADVKRSARDRVDDLLSRTSNR